MKKEDLRIIFMGTPEFAVETLQRLVGNGYPVVAVVTQPDKPVGRHQDTLQPSAVKKYAVSKNIPVLQPEKMKDPAFIEQLRSYKADLQVVVAFRMLPEIVWAMPRWGTFNVHAALLPQYRGAAPINWAVINGEEETGVTTFFLDKDIDTGRIIKQKSFEITDDANVETVYDGLMHLGADIAIETIDELLATDGKVPTIAQEDMLLPEGTVLRPAPKIFRETCEISWQQTAKKVYDFVRGLSPYPGAWTTLIGPDGKGTVLKIFRTAKVGDVQLPNTAVGSLISKGGHLYVKTLDSWLELVELQLSGKKRMIARDFLNGIREIEQYKVK
ncbi:MAG: methionyl-tRNA formyltransferase [Prevotella sp.]|nr:methionyl-tRNA formyltransferase [Prevotella sp.]